MAQPRSSSARLHALRRRCDPTRRSRAAARVAVGAGRVHERLLGSPEMARHLSVLVVPQHLQQPAMSSPARLRSHPITSVADLPRRKSRGGHRTSRAGGALDRPAAGPRRLRQVRLHSHDSLSHRGTDSAGSTTRGYRCQE